MKKIISVSRRADIPAFQSDWFFKALKAGEVSYKVSSKHLPAKVSLSKEYVLGFVFWSKSYAGFMDKLDELDSYEIPFYMHFTINNYPNMFEPGVPSLDKRVNNFISLSKRYGRNKIIWRYDPIFFTHDFGIKEHLVNFETLLNQFGEYTDSCYVSVIDLYEKILKKVLIQKSFDFDLINNQEAISELIGSMCDMCKKKDIQLFTCAEVALEKVSGIKKGACINSDLFADQLRQYISVPKSPTRKGCGCSSTIDIGTYNTCKHNCLYCYA